VKIEEAIKNNFFQLFSIASYCILFSEPFNSASLDDFEITDNL